MKLVDLNIGSKRTIEFAGKQSLTYIYKFPIDGSVSVTTNGLDGDKQADLVNHGGIDKAVYAYGLNHYAYWQDIIGEPLTSGALGENFTIDSLNEKEIYIGDTFQCNDLIIKATQFRQPCFKLGVKFDVPKLPQQFIDYGYSGIYFKVLQAGTVKAGDRLEKVEEHTAKVSVYDLFNACFSKSGGNETVLKKAAELEDLPLEWREKIARRVAKLKS